MTNRTPYSSKNAAFSNKAHLLARKVLYPKIFKVPFERLSFEDTLLEYGKRGEVLDGKMAIDRIVTVTAFSEALHHPISFTIQERFRRPDPYYISQQDITFTEWNYQSNLPSELYKLTANIFLYGYFDKGSTDQSAHFVDAIAIDIPITLMGICNNELPFTIHPNKRTNQSFIAIKFLDLWKYGVVLYWEKRADSFKEME